MALGGCSEGGTSGTQTINFSEPDELRIQPIQVCKDDGSNCAQVNLFADITAKILEQANLKVSFLPTNRLNESRFLSINDRADRGNADYEFYELTRTGEDGAFGRHPDSSDDSGPINVWFVDTIEALNGFTQFGLAWVDANGVIISKDTLEFGDNGRTDTVAHEIGHNLGLRHSTLGAGGANNILTDGDRRNIPDSVDDIGEDGAGLSTFTDAQIAAIKRSPFVTSAEAAPPNNEVSSDAQLIASLDQSAQSATALSKLLENQPNLLTEADSTSSQPAQVPEPSIWIGLSVLGLSILKAKQAQNVS